MRLNFELSEDVVNFDSEKSAALMEPSKKKHKSKADIDKGTDTHKYTAENFPIPQLSSRTLAILEKKDLLNQIKPFVKEVGDHFKNVIDTSNTPKNIYRTYVEALLINFPQIGDSIKDAIKGKAEEIEGPTDLVEPSEEEDTPVSFESATKEESEKVTMEFGVILFFLVILVVYIT